MFRRVCTAPETRPLPAVSRARDVDRLSSGGEGAAIPWPVIRGLMAIVLPGYAPPYHPFPAVLRRFGRATAGYVDRLQAVTGSRSSREQRRKLTGRSPPPPSCPRRRFNSDRAGDSMYLAKIERVDRDPGIAILDPGMRFPGN